MRRNVELYIKLDSSDAGEYNRIDLYEFEDININNSIKDARDIGKVFTEFTQEFKVPASKNNNFIFSHYYNWDIINGFDARIKVKGLIKINGVDYKKGRITLKGASLKKNKAKNYSIVFYGETVGLKQLFSDDKLKDLNTGYLNKFSLPYTSDNVKFGLKSGYNLVGDTLVNNTGTSHAGDLCVPFISSRDYYFYDSTVPSPNPAEGASASRNLNISETNTPRGVIFADLKFGIRIYHIIKAIEERYGLTFSDDFFSTTNLEFYELYMLLSKESGRYSGTAGTVVTDIDDFSLDSGNDLRPLTTWNAVRGADVGYQKYEVTYTVQTLYPSALYNVTVTDTNTGTEYLEQSGGGLSTTFVFNVESGSGFTREEIVRNLQFKIQGENVGNFGQSLSIERTTREYVESSGFVTTTETSDYSLAGESLKFNAIGSMPDIKVIDFLTSLFKTFNLVAYFDNDEIVVKTLNDYYDEGQQIDLTKYIDNDAINLNRTNLYSIINFEFEKPSTFAVLNSNNITSDEFGNEKMNNLSQNTEIFNTLAFDGGTYNVKNKFEKVMYERSTNQTGGANTNIGWGWLVNDNQDPVNIKPLLFYAIKQSLSSDPSGNSPSVILWDNGDSTYDTSFLTQYIRPSNTRSYYNGSLLVEEQSINFGSEVDEFHQVENTKSLFDTYYKEYVEDIYNRRSRIVKAKAFLPVSIILKMTLDDEIIINNRLYGINKMKLNLNTGKADLELMTRTESKLS